MQRRIASFLQKKYICTVCCAEDNQPWANSFYYVFDEQSFRLIYVSGEQTHHAKVMTKNPNVAGTVCTPTRFHPSLQGIQFTGQAKCLRDSEADIARELYKKEYTHDIIDKLGVWEISLEYVRMIDQSLGLFGTIEWRRGEPTPEYPPELQPLANL